ncbi:hypothetical protein Golax_018135, partial [Gossypium laxum]|nr:hypothetical protein [Gossypium laxum]
MDQNREKAKCGISRRLHFTTVFIEAHFTAHVNIDVKERLRLYVKAYYVLAFLSILCNFRWFNGRAKLKALELIDKGYKAQYEKIYEYLLELRTQNARTTTICYLGYFGGYLLAAVGIDTKSDIYLIAYVVVESENEASLCWFLELLLLDLEIVRSYKISFMFNKQKGLVEKICLLFPNAKTRNCIRHLHQNFKKVSFKTKALKNLLWKAARVSTQRDFEDVMAELKKLMKMLMIDNYYAKETQLAICSIFIRPIRCPKYWEPLLNMLSILSPPIRRSSGRPTTIRRKEPDEPQITTK